MTIRKWDICVLCMTSSHKCAERAPDKNIAIENIRGRFMSDMKNWNFSVSLDSDNGKVET